VELLTTKEVSERVHLSHRRVTQLANEDKLEGRKSGRKWLFPKLAIDRFLGEATVNTKISANLYRLLETWHRELDQFAADSTLSNAKREKVPLGEGTLRVMLGDLFDSSPGQAEIMYRSAVLRQADSLRGPRRLILGVTRDPLFPVLIGRLRETDVLELDDQWGNSCPKYLDSFSEWHWSVADFAAYNLKRRDLASRNTTAATFPALVQQWEKLTTIFACDLLIPVIDGLKPSIALTRVTLQLYQLRSQAADGLDTRLGDLVKAPVLEILGPFADDHPTRSTSLQNQGVRVLDTCTECLSTTVVLREGIATVLRDWQMQIPATQKVQ